MSTIENIKTAEEFAASWVQTPLSQQQKEIESFYKETHRIIDNWPYFQDEVGLYVDSFDKFGNKGKIYIKDITKQETYPESAEAIFNDKLDSWLRQNNEGRCLWISPPFSGKYPCFKIDVHQIAYEFENLRKTSLSSAILFETSSTDALNTIHALFPQTQNITDIEQFRPLLIELDEDFDINNLFAAIKILDPDSLQDASLDEEEIKKRSAYISDLIQKGVTPRQVAYQMQKQGLVGNHSISCPPSVSRKSGNKTEVGRFIRCPKCGTSVLFTGPGFYICPNASCGNSAFLC